jgi:hypothetical protein
MDRVSVISLQKPIDILDQKLDELNNKEKISEEELRDFRRKFNLLEKRINMYKPTTTGIFKKNLSVLSVICIYYIIFIFLYKNLNL